MRWFTVSAVGASRDLWLNHTGAGKPEYGRWVSPGGMDVDQVLEDRGPDALDVKVWWIPQPEHYGSRLRDMVWTTGLSGFKIVSTDMARVLADAGGRFQTYDIEIRLRNGEFLDGYVGLLEETHNPGPVHSLWRGRRSHDLVVSEPVLDAIKDAGLSGIEVTPVDGPFPADQPGFFDEPDEL